MAEMKNICGKIPVELHEKVRAEIEEKETSTQIFIRQVIEEHFNRLEGKGEESMEKRTLWQLEFRISTSVQRLR